MRAKVVLLSEHYQGQLAAYLSLALVQGGEVRGIYLVQGVVETMAPKTMTELSSY